MAQRDRELAELRADMQHLQEWKKAAETSLEHRNEQLHRCEEELKKHKEELVLCRAAADRVKLGDSEEAAQAQAQEMHVLEAGSLQVEAIQKETEDRLSEGGQNFRESIADEDAKKGRGERRQDVSAVVVLEMEVARLRREIVECQALNLSQV